MPLVGDDAAGGVVGNVPGILDAGLAKYASLDRGLFCRKTGLRWGVRGIGIEAGSLGGGSGAGGAKVGGGSGAEGGCASEGGGVTVLEVSESVDGGRGGNVDEDEDIRRPLLMDEAPKDERRVVAMAQKLRDGGFRKRMWGPSWKLDKLIYKEVFFSED